MENVLEKSALSGVQKFARHHIFNLLAQMETAGLILEENGETYRFGQIEAPLQGRLRVHSPAFYSRVLFGGSVAAGETWVESLWSSPNLLKVIRIFARSLALVERLENRMAWLRKPAQMLWQLSTRNTQSGSRANIAAHYDLGNDMYQIFLDPMMQYSSAIFPFAEASLAQAQLHKVKIICEKLQLQPGDEVLEIGSGWGGLACHMASHFDCRVTTTTLSQAQYEFAKKMITERGLQNKIDLLLQDYRELEGEYDKIVSVEMIEAVGHDFLPAYFRHLGGLLKPTGRMLIQAITIADQRYRQYRRSQDFIQRYIFPGGALPSLSEMCRHLHQQTDMTVNAVSSHGKDYAQTLNLWQQSFNGNTERLAQLGYNADFQRLWQFYFAYCEAGFREGAIDLLQFEAKKPEARRCRDGNGFS